MWHVARDFREQQLGDLQQAANEFIEIWDAWQHDDCVDTFADAEEAITAKVDAIRAVLTRTL